MEVDPSSPVVPEDSSSSCINLVDYRLPETSAWIAQEAAAYWDSLDESNKQEILAVSPTRLVTFLRGVMKAPWLADFLLDAIAFFELHNTWETYVCPNQDCLRLFKDDESLIIHLKCDHFSDIHPVAWPPPQHNLVQERRCADALHKMVWKPIVVEAALDLLSTMCLDHEHITMADVCAGSDRLSSLDWLFSEDLERKRLLLELEEGFQVLLAKQEQASFSLISDGFFMTITSLASEHIFVDHPPRYNLSFLQCILAHSPLSFCMLEARHLPQFVKLVKAMTQLIEQAPLHSVNRELDSAECDFSWSKSAILDAPSVSIGADIFVSVQAGSLHYGGGESILSSLCSAPSIPSTQLVPNEASEIFSHVKEILESLREGCTITGPWCNGCWLKYQPTGPLNIPWDYLLPLMGVDYNRVSTSHLLWKPHCLFGDPNKLYCIESHLESKVSHLQLVKKLQCLESQLRCLCAVDCQKYILLLMESFLRLRLYVCLKSRGLEVDGNPVAECEHEIVDDLLTFYELDRYQSPMISHQEENAEQEVSSDESKAEYGSDYDTDTDESFFGKVDNEDGFKSKTNSKPEMEYELDSKLGDKPWMEDPTLCKLDSTLRESATGKTKDTGPFFWMAVSDILRHCLKDCNPVGYKSVLDGIRRFRLNKAWKYSLCYSCDETFVDQESHMVHLEDKHQLCLAHDDYWLIPKKDSRDEVEEFRRDEVEVFRQDEVKSEPGLEDSITLDHTYRYFLVDSTKFNQIPSANEEEELGQAKRKEYMEIVDGLHSELRHLRSLFHTKCECLVYLEVVNALSLILFNGGQPLSLLVIWLHKLSTMDRRTGTTHQLQFRFLSQLLCQAHDQRYGPLSNYSVQNAFQNMRDDLISKIDCQDQQILELLVRIDDVKRNLSDLCVCDYRTEIVPSVRSFLHAKFKFDNSLRSLGCKEIEELLSSLGKGYLLNTPTSFTVVVRSPGNVVINTRKKMKCWGLAFIGISLEFDGEWSSLGKMLKMTGVFEYGGLFTWLSGSWKNYGKVIPHVGRSHADMGLIGIHLDYCLCSDVSRRLSSLHTEYYEQVSTDGEL